MKWFTSYLKDRKQYVELPFLAKWNKLFNAKIKNLNHFIWSTARLYFRTCYSNVILKHVSDVTTVSGAKNKMSLYADNMKLIISNKSLNEIVRTVNKSLITINNYFSGITFYLTHIRQISLHFLLNKASLNQNHSLKFIKYK